MLLGLGVAGVWALSGCGDETATGLAEGLLPFQPRTLEIALPWSEFGVDLQVLGGFGRVSEIPQPVVAHEYDGALEARLLTRFDDYPGTLTVIDTLGATRVDTLYTVTGARVVAVFDTLRSTGPSQLVAHRMQQEWDRRTATWASAVDSLGVRIPWEEPGAGPAPDVGSASWDPEISDTVRIPVSPEAATAWGDTADASRGLRLDANTPGSYLALLSLRLEVDAEPSLNPDTVITFTVQPGPVTVLYTPSPGDPGGSIRVGGAPAWRSVIEMDVPTVVDGPPGLCAQVTCPYTLDPSRLNLATLELTTRRPEAGFLPIDSVFVDARAVLDPDRLPKSPLGFSYVIGGGLPLGADLFGDGTGSTVSIPVTSFVRDLIRGETSSGDEPPRSLALLTFSEPLSILFSSFVGPGGEGEPVLRMVLTTSDTVEIR